MGFIWDGFRNAIVLLVHGDREVWSVTARSLVVSGWATAVAVLLGVALGMAAVRGRFRGRGLLLALINTGMGLPPVVVGLFLVILLARNGPLGGLDILYTTRAMILAQGVIALPVAAGFTVTALQTLDPLTEVQLRALGAARWQVWLLLLREARLGLLAGVMGAFGAAVSEVGASLQVGANIPGQTRVLTTATVLETGMGRYDVAIALSLILLALIFVVNLVLTIAQQRGAAPWP